MNLLIVTGIDLGWDCVVAVYPSSDENLAKLEKAYPERDYTITEMSLSNIKELDGLV